MPLMHIDLIKGRSKNEIKKILDVSYEVMLEVFKIPKGDRYQIVSQHENYEMQILDSGLGIERTNKVIVFSITSRFRPQDQKQLFYSMLVTKLHEEIGIRPEDVMINITSNKDEDWSFFSGKAQFLTNDLV